jgi:hypothetical protein
MTPERHSGTKAGGDGPSATPEFEEGTTREEVVSALVALTAEVYLLRERLHTLEAELAQRKVVPAGAVEKHASSAAEDRARRKDLDAFVGRVLAAFARSDSRQEQANAATNELRGRVARLKK